MIVYAKFLHALDNLQIRWGCYYYQCSRDYGNPYPRGSGGTSKCLAARGVSICSIRFLVNKGMVKISTYWQRQVGIKYFATICLSSVFELSSMIVPCVICIFTQEKTASLLPYGYCQETVMPFSIFPSLFNGWVDYSVRKSTHFTNVVDNGIYIYITYL